MIVIINQTSISDSRCVNLVAQVLALGKLKGEEVSKVYNYEVELRVHKDKKIYTVKEIKE